jgi:hypothetical protein
MEQAGESIALGRVQAEPAKGLKRLDAVLGKHADKKRADVPAEVIDHGPEKQGSDHHAERLQFVQAVRNRFAPEQAHGMPGGPRGQQPTQAVRQQAGIAAPCAVQTQARVAEQQREGNVLRRRGHRQQEEIHGGQCDVNPVANGIPPPAVLKRGTHALVLAWRWPC